ncbi:MAG: M23 family metallopeptidase [Dysgonamonadaceae bacterium]|nr:M23 family metallopeptidase [Dysgonamonadaceae bacterium]
MKYNLLFFTLLWSFCGVNVHAQQDPDHAVQLSSELLQSQRRLIFTANNRDYCDYYVYITFINAQGFDEMGRGALVVVSPGQNQIISYRMQENASGYSYNYQYVMYRGNFNKKADVDYIYSLPTLKNQTVTANVRENQLGYQLEFQLPSDTVYATRSGVVCDDNLKDQTARGHRSFNGNHRMQQITVYHDDASFGEYIFEGRSLVRPGQVVKMGESIAVIQQEMNTNSLRFSVYFLDRNKVNSRETGNKHTHFRPFFQTSDAGKVRLEHGKTYISELNDEMLMQGMNSRQRRAFLQNRAEQ